MRFRLILVLLVFCSLSASCLAEGERSSNRKHFLNGEQPTIKATVIRLNEPPSGDLNHLQTTTLIEAPFGRMKVSQDCTYQSSLSSGVCTFEITDAVSGKKLRVVSRILPNDSNYHFVAEIGATSFRIDGSLNPEGMRQFLIRGASAAFENQVRQTIRLGWMAPELAIPRTMIRLFGLDPGQGSESFAPSGQLTSVPLDCAFDAGFGFECPAKQQLYSGNTIGVTRY